jgi:DNA polymerase-3 subunit gamma/tau
MSRPLPPVALDNPAVPERPVAPPVPSPRIEVTAPPPATSRPDAAAAPDIGIDAERWLDLVDRCDLRGPVRELAAHAAFVACANGTLRLALSAEDDHLRSAALIKALADALSAQLGGPVQLKFETGKAANAETMHARNARQRDEKQAAAEEAFLGHPDVQRLMQQQGAKLVPDSIRPFED